MEEVPVGLPFPHPPVEEMIHNSVLAVEHIDIPSGEKLTLLKMYTPAKVYTLKLNSEVAEAVANDLRPSPVQIARVVPK